MHVIVYDVEMGQSIFFYPKNNPEYGTLIDCGNSSGLQPIDHIIKNGLLPIDPANNQKYLLNNLTLTNYDHDHFSGLTYLLSKVTVKTIHFAKNITSQQLRDLKKEETEQLNHLLHLKDTYTGTPQYYSPPFTQSLFSLNIEELEKGQRTTNNLSQMIFMEYKGMKMCIPGDLEEAGWKVMLTKQHIRNHLSTTNIFVAPHHGRSNGYHSELFNHCFPECIIISDKHIIYGTQENMASRYSQHVNGNGIILNGDGANPRKVITTRSDGHIHIEIDETLARHYKTL